MNSSFSHTLLSATILLLGMLCLGGCSLYHNFVWYEPHLIDENGKEISLEVDDKDSSSEKSKYIIQSYYTKTTAVGGFMLLFPFIPLGEDYEGPHPSRHTGDFVIWVEKEKETPDPYRNTQGLVILTSKNTPCPVVYIDDKPAYGKVLENEPYDITGINETHYLCHYGKRPIEDQQIYIIKFNDEEKRYLFIKKQWYGYIPIWLPSA